MTTFAVGMTPSGRQPCCHVGAACWNGARCAARALEIGAAAMLLQGFHAEECEKIMTAGPLSRFTVLDLTRVRAGPTAVRYLADWGANCIKVEMPPSAGESDMGGPRHGPDFQNLHRNKKSITLNLKEPDGKAIFMKMVEKADVVVENYRADVKYRLGIDYDSLKKVNPSSSSGRSRASART